MSAAGVVTGQGQDPHVVRLLLLGHAQLEHGRQPAGAVPSSCT